MEIPSVVMLMRSVKVLALMVSEKKPTLKGLFVFMRKYVNYLH